MMPVGLKPTMPPKGIVSSNLTLSANFYGVTMTKIIVRTTTPKEQPEVILPNTITSALLDWFADEENGTAKASLPSPHVLAILSATHRTGRITEQELSNAVITALLRHCDTRDADVVILHAERRDNRREI